MHDKFTTIPVTHETRQAVKVIAAQNSMSMYEVVDRLVKNGENLIK